MASEPDAADPENGIPVQSAERQPLLRPTDVDEDSVELKQQPAWQRHDTFKLVTVIFDFFVMGVCQTAVGALIPNIEHFYDLGDGATASIFVAHMFGYLCATATIEHIHVHLGRRGIAIISPLVRLFAAALLSTGPPFQVTLVLYGLYGFGVALVDAGWCAWASGLPYANVCQGIMHGAYSTGAIVGPLAGLAVLKKGFEWNGFYRFASALFCLEVVAQGLAFQSDDASSYRASWSESGDDNEQISHPIRKPATWICGLFFCLCVGIESSFSDWLVVFMRRVRHVEPLRASLASSSFWVGMAVGRLALGFVTEYFGLGISVAAYIAISTIPQVVLRLVTNTNGSLALLALTGFFNGPLFPSGILLLSTKLPAKSYVGAVAIGVAIGQVGGALAPLGIGLLADRFGIQHLLDVVLPLSMAALVTWLTFWHKT